MSWKKNVFSCLMWAVYLLFVGTAMIFTFRLVCDSFGMADYLEVVIPAVYLLFAGIIVFLLHRLAYNPAVGFQSKGKILIWTERILIPLLFVAGIFLRAVKVQPELLTEAAESVYLKLAYISADGQGIPQFSHGAVYLYMWVLRFCFMLLGNKAAAAVWMQILLQMAGVLVLYFAVRKMAGRIPAVILVFFFMLSPYMVEKSLVPSPEMIYLLAFSLALLYISGGVGYVFGWGFWLAAGVITAVLGYLDVAGLLLLPLILGVIVMRQDVERKIMGSLSGCLAGFLSGIAACVMVDAVSSGKPVSGILRAWMELYQSGELQLSVTISGFDTVWTIILILCLMAWGLFGFWCHREVERFTVWIFCFCAAVLLQCLGMFTKEMDGFCFIFFFSTVLAGLGIRESMAAYPVQMPEEGPAGHWGSGMDDIIIQDLEEDEIVGEKDKTVSKHSMESKAEEKQKQEQKQDKKQEQKMKIEFLENPLPLPKKHVKRVMDYKLDSDKNSDGYDVYVAEDDDFDY